jgi:hypothetical protein
MKFTKELIKGRRVKQPDFTSLSSSQLSQYFLTHTLAFQNSYLSLQALNKPL